MKNAVRDLLVGALIVTAIVLTVIGIWRYRKAKEEQYYKDLRNYAEEHRVN